MNEQLPAEAHAPAASAAAPGRAARIGKRLIWIARRLPRLLLILFLIGLIGLILLLTYAPAYFGMIDFRPRR